MHHTGHGIRSPCPHGTKLRRWTNILVTNANLKEGKKREIYILEVPMLSTLMGLDAFQTRFVEADVGPVMLSGGPGVGKTRSMVARAIRLMLLGMRPDDVALVTPHDHLVPHLRAELEGMPERFQRRRRLLEREEGDIDQLQRAVRFGTHIFVGTPYQYARRLLRNHGVVPFTVWTDDEAVAVISQLERLLPQTYGIAYEPGRGTARRFYHWQGELKVLLPGNPAPPVPMEAWRQLYKAYAEERTLQGACDRYDLLADAREIADRLNAGRDGYAVQRPHFLVDDFQDLPEAVFWLLDALCGRQQSLSVAVDPGQPVDGDRPFRAREVFLGIYLRAPEYWVLASRRSTRSVTNAVERIALHGRPEEAPSPYRGYVGQDERAPAVRLHVLSGRRTLEVAHVFRLVEASLGKDGAYSEIAVICPDDGQAASLTAAFWARGVPYSIDPALTGSARLLPISVSAAPVPCVQQVIFALRLFVNPFDRAAFRDAVSMALAPGRASLREDEFAQVTQLSREGNLNLVLAARLLIQHNDGRRRLDRILPPLLNLHAELERAAGEAAAPGTLRDFMETATRIVAELRPDPPTLRDEAQVEQLLSLAGGHSVPRGQTVTQALRMFLDRFSPGLHPSDGPLQDGGFAEPDNRVTITTAEGAYGRWWPHVIVLAEVNPARGRAAARQLFRAASAAGSALDIIVPPLTTAGRDIATANSMREILGNAARGFNVTRRQVDEFYQEW